MAVAVRDESEFRRMAFDLRVEEDWPPVSVETLWVKAVSERTFRIDSIPFFVNGIAAGDLVAGEVEREGLLRYSGKLQGGGHSTIHVILFIDEAGPAVMEELKRIGCDTEVSPWPSLFSVDVPNRDLVAETHRILGVHADVGEIEYEDACIAGLA